jgi:hypothetical protein
VVQPFAGGAPLQCAIFAVGKRGLGRAARMAVASPASPTTLPGTRIDGTFEVEKMLFFNSLEFAVFPVSTVQK